MARTTSCLYQDDTWQVECPTVERLVEEQELDEAGDNRDPWGKDYVVECGEGVSVRSAGPDRTLQTDDDVVIPHT